MTRTVALSATDLVFLWEQCRRCFYLKATGRLVPPRLSLPRIFTDIDRSMKEHFGALLARGTLPGLPAGQLVPLQQVRSEPLPVSPRLRCVLRGQPDAVIQLAGGAGYAVVDFKTAPASADALARYSRQLHAYAWALERAAAGVACCRPVRQLGLLVFTPATFGTRRAGHAQLSGPLRWIGLPRDDAGFSRLLAEVAAVLSRRRPPPPAARCPFCSYRRHARRSRL